MIDAQGRITSANHNACRILGRSAASLEWFDGADPVWRLFDADDQPVPVEQHPINLTLRTGMPQQNWGR